MKRRGIGFFATLLIHSAGCQDQASISGLHNGDIYYQGGGHVVMDVLWVIDDSGTMTEEQATLQASLAPFLDALLAADIDFHLAVVTTDVDNSETAGRFIGKPSILSRDTPDLYDAFASAADVGVSGSPSEQGLRAVELALSEPLLSGPNAGFLRSDAELAIVVISDEDDQSTLSIQEFETFASGLKSKTSYLVSGVVGDAPYGCASTSGAADPANRYLQLIQDSGGVTQSICSDDYSPMMTRLVQLLSHIWDTFPLTRIPDPDSIEVAVDGVTIRQRDTDGWKYLPESNAIRIVGTPLPDPGQEIYIRYDDLRL